MVVTFGEGIVLTFNTALTDSDSLGTSTPSSAQKLDTVSIPSTSPPPKCSSKGRGKEIWTSEVYHIMSYRKWGWW